MSSTPDEASERRARAAAGVRRPGDDAQQERLRRLLMGVGFVVVVGAIVAGVIIFQGGGSGSTAQRTPPLPVSAASHGVTIGKAGAPVHVVVYEDFGDPVSRQLEEASRDYLHADASAGRVYVDYRPVASRNGYSRSALNAFATVLDVAGPRTALRLHDLLFDHQPAAGAAAPGDDQLVALATKAGARRAAVAGPIASSAQQQWVESADAAARKAGIRGLPTVLLDGKPLTGTSVVGLADRLETIIARKG